MKDVDIQNGNSYLLIDNNRPIKPNIKAPNTICLMLFVAFTITKKNKFEINRHRRNHNGPFTRLQWLYMQSLANSFIEYSENKFIDNNSNNKGKIIEPNI